MKIDNIMACCDTKISDIDVGECFMYKGELHMKVNIGSLDYSNMHKYPNVIVNLETNRLNSTIDSAIVKRVKAKIVIE